MAMTIENSLLWQAESEAEQIAALRESLGDNVNEAVIQVMAMLYRKGWNDCFKLARLHSVKGA
jgi:hypothetical protein